MQYDQLISDLEKLLKENSRCIIGIDGRCAGGKTTLSNLLAGQFPARVFHMDDFYLPVEQRVAGGEKLPCANMDFGRMIKTVLQPAKKGEAVQYEAYSCRKKRLLPPVELTGQPLTIVEGSYSHYPELLPFYDLTVFLTCRRETQKERLIEREGERYPNYERLWIPLEEGYYRKYHVGERVDYRIATDEP